MRDYRVAVVGCGIGKMHIEAWRKLPGQFTVALICDIDEAKAKNLAADFSIAEIATSLDAVLARRDIDVIDICTPPNTHVDLAVAALKAGKHVVLEKPIAGSLADCDRLKRAAARAKGQLLPVFQYRFGNGYLKLKHLIDKGVPGKLYLSTIETSWTRGAAYYSVPWRGKWATELGGCLTTHAIHAHDMLRWIAGPYRSVFARTTTRVNPIEVEDCAAIAFTMADGSPATSAVTLGSATEISRLRFCFENLTAESSLLPYKPSYEPWTFTAMRKEDQAKIEAALADFAPGHEGFAGLFARFHDALEKTAPLPVSLDDGRASIELLTALYRSAQTGKAVDLPLKKTAPGYAGWRPKRARSS